MLVTGEIKTQKGTCCVEIIDETSIFKVIMNLGQVHPFPWSSNFLNFVLPFFNAVTGLLS